MWSMGIRQKLFVFFSVTILILVAVGIYGSQLYRQVIVEEEAVLIGSNQSIELAYQSKTLLTQQYNAWKNLLLRGQETDLYYRHLQAFYEAERRCRSALDELLSSAENTPRVRDWALEVKQLHYDMGRDFRSALVLLNAQEATATGEVDRLTGSVEAHSLVLLGKIIASLQELRHSELSELQAFRLEQEQFLATLLLTIVLVSFIVFVGILDKNIARPAERAEFLADVIDNAQKVAQFGTWDWDAAEERHYWSDGVYEMLAIDPATPPSQEAFLSAIDVEERQDIRDILSEAKGTLLPFEFEARAVSDSNTLRILQVRGQVKQTSSGGLRMTNVLYDVTERVKDQERLAYQANYDQLTSLPNRTLFHDRLLHAMAQADRKNSRVALMFLDLDRFKAVNDALGHSIGDALLVQVADRLRQTIRASDTAARLGGDEFTIVLDSVKSNKHVETVARHVLDAINQEYQVGSHQIYVSTSIGITFYPDDGVTLDTLLKNADSAMYLAKDKGRSTYHFFTQELNIQAKARLALETDLRKALEHNEFQLYFQPLISLNNGKVVGAEALLRWNREGEVVSPAVFIPALEETGLILNVGNWVLETACQTARMWREKGYSDLVVAVNLSIKQLRQSSIVDQVRNALARVELSPDTLELELTESSLIDSDLSQQNLKELERLGVRLAIDDFGTGYSSLSYLRQFKVDGLKIDRSFIQDIRKDTHDEAITAAIVTLCHTLGMRVTAEGVETTEQLAFLRKLECQVVQGFLIARPMPGDVFLDWLNTYASDEGNVWSQLTEQS